MKKLLFLLLIPITLLGQTRSPDQYLLGTNGKPIITPSTLNSYAVDWKAKVVWRSASTVSTSTNKWVQETDTNVIKFYFNTGVKGDKGDTGPMGPQGNSITGPQGPMGPQGPPGVCPSCPPSSGGGTSTTDIYHIITNGVDDTPAIQRAVDSAYVTGRTIFLDGYLKMSSGVKIQKNHRVLNIVGFPEIWATNSGTWTFFYSDVPASVAEAEGVYGFRKIAITNMILHGNGTQNGFDLHCTEGARYDHIWCYDMKTAFLLTFSLRSRVIQCEANNCIDGLVIQSASGLYSGATTSNSCSNGTTVEDFRAYGSSSSNTGIKVYDASLVKLDGVEIEGGKFNIGIDHGCMSGTSTGADDRRIHFEAAQPCTEAVIKVRSSTMIHTFDQLNLIKPSIYFKTDNAGGYPSMKISNVSNQRVLFDGVNKILMSGGGTSWKFSNCDLPFAKYNKQDGTKGCDIPNMFTTPMNEGCGQGVGANTWCIDSPVNR